MVISSSATGARSRIDVDAILSAGDGSGTFRQGIGYYDDELVQRDGEWRIHRRHFTAVRIG